MKYILQAIIIFGTAGMITYTGNSDWAWMWLWIIITL